MEHVAAQGPRANKIEQGGVTMMDALGAWQPRRVEMVFATVFVSRRAFEHGLAERGRRRYADDAGAADHWHWPCTLSATAPGECNPSCEISAWDEAWEDGWGRL